MTKFINQLKITNHTPPHPRVVGRVLIVQGFIPLDGLTKGLCPSLQTVSMYSYNVQRPSLYFITPRGRNLWAIIPPVIPSGVEGFSRSQGICNPLRNQWNRDFIPNVNKLPPSPALRVTPVNNPVTYFLFVPACPHGVLFGLLFALLYPQSIQPQSQRYPLPLSAEILSSTLYWQLLFRAVSGYRKK